MTFFLGNSPFFSSFLFATGKNVIFFSNSRFSLFRSFFFHLLSLSVPRFYQRFLNPFFNFLKLVFFFTRISCFLSLSFFFFWSSSEKVFFPIIYRKFSFLIAFEKEGEKCMYIYTRKTEVFLIIFSFSTFLTRFSKIFLSSLVLYERVRKVRKTRKVSVITNSFLFLIVLSVWLQFPRLTISYDKSWSDASMNSWPGERTKPELRFLKYQKFRCTKIKNEYRVIETINKN